MKTLDLFQGSSGPCILLFFLSVAYLLENFDRYVISISPIPYVDYTSYEYSILAGPAFTIIYTVGGLMIALYFHSSTYYINVILRVPNAFISF